MKVRGSKNIIIFLLAIFLIILYSFYYYFEKNKLKVILIALDGADWKVMQPLIDKGKLSNIKQLMDKGCWGALKTFEPLESEIIWTSIATGKTLQKHGITRRLMEDPDTGMYVPPTSNQRKVKAIWNILSDNNMNVGLVNYMVTRPPEKIKGVIISGPIVDLNDIDYYSRERSYPLFINLCPKEDFERFKILKNDIFSGIDRNMFPMFWWDVQKIDNFAAQFYQYLLKKENFNFSSLYIRGVDVTSHIFWSYLFPEEFEVSQEDVQKYKDVINNYYIWCDTIIGSILREMDKHTIIFIVSDHGFQKRPQENSMMFTKVDYLLEICGINKIKKGDKIAILKNESSDMQFPKKNIKIIGELSKEEFNEVRMEAKNVLKNIKVVETGDYLFDNIKDTKDGFSFELPNYYIRKKREFHFMVQNEEYKIMDLLVKHFFPGDHREFGIIIVSGDSIVKNKKIDGATIFDITPTILYIMRLPVAKDMDGKVLVNIFEKSYLKSNPIRYIDTYETDKQEAIRKPIRYINDEEKIKEKMRSLGYIN